MRYGFLVQTLGSVAVFGAFLAAECVAYLLYRHPGSTLLWYLNLEVFRPFGAFGTPFQSTLRDSLTPAAILAVLCAAVAAHLLRCRVTVGLIANVSSMLVAALAYHVLFPDEGTRAVSLRPLNQELGVDTWLLVVVCAISLGAAAFSHYSFLRSASSSTRS